jgi:hypothetical protein
MNAASSMYRAPLQVLLWLVCSSLAACSSGQAEPAPRAPQALTRVHHATGRVVAVGDLHGDLDITRKVLRAAGAIDTSDKWIGGKLVVVQTGDTIDRGDDDRAVIDLLERLRGEAKKAGGELIAMSGNHETMNVAGDLRYVSEASAAAFEQGRAQAFAPGGPYARIFASWPVITKVDRSVFVHGGVLLKHVRYGIDRVNDETAAWMRGERAAPVIMMGEDAPVWSRLYSADDALPAEACAQLKQVLSELGADRMVVGHTPQARGINSACGDRVWRIDTGLSHHYGGPLEWLEIEAGRARVGGRK